jgi:acetyl-CoA carboxylase beta subunit
MVKCKGCGKKLYMEDDDEEAYLCHFCGAALCPECSPSVFYPKIRVEVYSCEACAKKRKLRVDGEVNKYEDNDE